MRSVAECFVAMGFRKFKCDMIYARKDLMLQLHGLTPVHLTGIIPCC